MNICLFGATSAIASAVAEIHARAGDSLLLVGRDPDKLDHLEKHLRILGAADVATLTANLADGNAMATLANKANAHFKDGIDRALIAHGTLTDTETASNDAAYLAAEINTNFTSAAILTNELVRLLKTKPHSRIGVISSVAGDRGRASNFPYGAAKAGLSTYIAGLQHQLAQSKSPLRITLIKPGIVRTPMTAHLQHGPLSSTPDKVAKRIVRAMQRGKATTYTPGIWALILLIIRFLPRPLFHRTKL